MEVTEVINHKRLGNENTPEELKYLLENYLSGKVPDYQMSAWLMAVCCKGMTPSELSLWTELMWKSGTTLSRKDSSDYWIDKHSTGGVGDKTSLILVPWVIATCRRIFGKGQVKIPMISGRGLGHSGGTLDKLESVSGFSSQIPIRKALESLERQDFMMIGQTGEIAPADKRIYALRDVTGTVQSIPLIVSSIMSKKLAENLNGIVLDVKWGSGAFMQKLEDATLLASELLAVVKSKKIDSVALITRMNEPLGRKVGNFIEVEECWEFLEGKTEDGLKEVSLALASEMVRLASRGKLSRDAAKNACEDELGRKEPKELFRKMFESQGGDWNAFQRGSERLRKETKLFEFRSSENGFLGDCDALEVGRLAVALGAGRQRAEDSVNPWVGLEIHKKVGDQVRVGEVLISVYSDGRFSSSETESTLKRAVRVASEPPQKEPWVTECLD